MEQLKHFVGKLGVARLLVLAAVVLATVGLAGWLLARVNQPQYALLYADLDPNESAKVVAQLDQAKIPYRLEADGATVLVAKDQVGRTRLALAERGLPSGGSIGYEIFDQNDALGSTNFVQNVKLARALEGELVRTIRSLDRVKGARVHIVLPRRDVLGRDRETPSASVVLQMQGNTRPTATQTRAIQQLVAAAIPNLAPTRVSIVDGQGTLLTDAQDGDDGTMAASRADERRRAFEKHLVGTIEQLLTRVVGPGRVRAEVSADMDFDRINTNEEIFDPDGQVARSTQSIADQTSNNENTANQPVGIANNLPDATGSAGGATGSASAQTRNEETVNYEISKKVIHHVRESGVVKRLSVAVLIDGDYVGDAEGKRQYTPRPQDELARLTALVRSAVGYDEKRGDRIEVVNMRFAGDDAIDEAPTATLLGFEKADVFRLVQYVAAVVLALLVLLTVVRPVVSRTIAAFPAPLSVPSAAMLGGRGKTAALSGPAGSAAPSGAALAAGGGGAALPGPGAGGALAAPRASGLAEDNDEMIDLDQVDGRVRASSMKRVGEIVEKHPEESLAIIRNWLHAED